MTYESKIKQCFYGRWLAVSSSTSAYSALFPTGHKARAQHGRDSRLQLPPAALRYGCRSREPVRCARAPRPNHVVWRGRPPHSLLRSPLLGPLKQPPLIGLCSYLQVVLYHGPCPKTFFPIVHMTRTDILFEFFYCYFGNVVEIFVHFIMLTNVRFLFSVNLSGLLPIVVEVSIVLV